MANRAQRVIFALAAALACGCVTATSGAQSRHAHRQALPRNSTAAPVPAKGRLGIDLFEAVMRRDAAGVQALLKRGADPNARNSLYWTPLMSAATTGQPDIMELLLRAGADKEASSPYGTPLLFAADPRCAHVLLSHGVDTHVARPDGITPLMLAAWFDQPGLAREFLRRKADPNAKDNDGETALSFAARAGNTDVGHELLNAGAKVDVADNRGWTALMHAAAAGHSDFVAILLK
ncbi:MAG TPA: ankyrin repeat domain-containing protein, partial [Chthonomonadales bacterium]|nr:ankyrin repeat domain-containing protein [Chthonomonadales bacterium]